MHLHGAGELNGSGQVGTGLLPPSFLALQGAEVKVAMRLKWAHDELLGQGLAVVSFGCLDSVEEIQTLFCHRARGSAPPEQPSVQLCPKFLPCVQGGIDRPPQLLFGLA